MTAERIARRIEVAPNLVVRGATLLVAAALLSLLSIGSAAAECGPHHANMAPRAVEHYETTKAAALGADKNAQVELAFLYRDGRGVQRNTVRAYAWLNVAARVVPDASVKRDRLAPCLNPGDQVKAQLLSLELLSASAPR